MTHTIVYNFQGGASDASNPHGDLHADGAGGFYGLAGAGTGPTGNGGLYKVTAPATADGVWTEQLLASFGGATGDGTAPDSFTMDGSGNFYVSLLLNGSSKRGQVVELTPGSSGYSLTVLHNFKAGHGSTDGTYPHSLTIANGVVYGVTGLGGTHNFGTFYSLTQSGGTWTETILYNFAGGATDGAGPGGLMLPDGSGGYYMVTKTGGTANVGTVVDIVPATNGFSDRLIYSFLGGANGITPCCGLVSAGNGSLYGVTAKGGSGNTGTFYRVTPEPLINRAGVWVRPAPARPDISVIPARSGSSPA